MWMALVSGFAVAMFAPWHMYLLDKLYFVSLSVLLLNAVPVHYPLRLEHDLVPTIEDIEACITPRTRVLVVNSPGNPSGALIPPQRLRELYELAQRHDLWVISDEVYDEIYTDEAPTSMRPLDVDDRVVDRKSTRLNSSHT